MNSAVERKSWPRWAACGFWLLCFALIMVDVAHKPKDHTTTPTYRFASTQWWRGQDPYTFDHRKDVAPAPPAPSQPGAWWMETHDDFVYFPQAAVIFTPFNLMPFYAGELFWRAVTFGLFAYALARLARFFLPDDKTGLTFLYLSLLAVPSSLASLRNAQFDLPMAALGILCTAAVASSRWAAAATWLCLAMALKPLAAVPLLLFGALYSKLIPRLILGLLIVVALPFLHWSPAYVAHEYVRCAQALGWASIGDAPKFSDLGALLSRVGYDAPALLKTIARVIFALIFLGLGALGVRRLKAVEAAWLVGALSADYLMLFNPRTETCSYVFLAPFIASLALYHAHRSASRWLVVCLSLTALGLACDGVPTIHHVSFHLMTDRWLKPLLALIFFGVLLFFLFGKRREGPSS